MKPCHAVDGIAAHDSQICHAHLSVVDDGHLSHLVLVARILRADSLQEAAVDLLHNLVYTGQQSGEQLNRPLFQGLRHDGVVGVGAGLGGHFPGLVPGQPLLIHEDPHELRNRHCGMGVVHLEGNFLIQFFDITVVFLIFFNSCLYAGGDKEVLLFQAQLLAGHVGVVGIKNLHDGPGQVLLLYRFVVIALVKGIQLEIVDGFRVPDPQGIHYVVAVAHHRQVIGNGPHRLISLLDKVVSSGVLIVIYPDVAAELDLLGVLRPFQFKGIAVLQPVIRHLHLISVPDLLLEHAVMVTDAAAVGHIAQGCQRVQEAGRQTAKTAVSESGIPLLILHGVQVNVQLLQSLLYFLIGGQIQQVIAQVSSGEELHGHVVNNFGILLIDDLLGLHPVIDDNVLHRITHRLVHLLGIGLLQSGTEQVFHIFLDNSLKCFLFEFRVKHFAHPPPFYSFSTAIITFSELMFHSFSYPWVLSRMISSARTSERISSPCSARISSIFRLSLA